MNEWKTVRLGEICEQINGVSYKPADVYDSLTEKAKILLRANNIFEDKLNYDELVFVDKKRISENQYMKKGDILICASSGSKHLVGKAACLTEDKDLTFGAFCKVLRPKTVNPEYIKHYFFSPSYRTEISRLSEGANINNIKAADLDNLKILLPSESIQNKIAKRLDKCVKIINNQKKALEKYDTLTKSRFIEMFGDLANNTKKWIIKNFTECAIIDTKMVKDFEEYADYPHIGIDSIEKKTGVLSGYRTVKEDNVISGKYLFTPEHIIYSKIRPNLNKVAMPNFNGLCSADAYPILVKNNITTREYLTYVMRSDFYVSYILAFSRRANMPKVNKEQVESFNLPLPPYELQKQFSSFVQQIDKSKFEIWLTLQNYGIIEKECFKIWLILTSC